jgi:hypothetical protein
MVLIENTPFQFTPSPSTSTVAALEVAAYHHRIFALYYFVTTIAVSGRLKLSFEIELIPHIRLPFTFFILPIVLLRLFDFCMFVSGFPCL